MRGIVGWGVHVPYRRLDRAGIAVVSVGNVVAPVVSDGNVRIGPIPSGTPINLLANVDLAKKGEVFKLLVAKLWDEQSGKPVRFKPHECEAQTRQAIVALLREAEKQWPGSSARPKSPPARPSCSTRAESPTRTLRCAGCAPHPSASPSGYSGADWAGAR